MWHSASASTLQGAGRPQRMRPCNGGNYYIFIDLMGFFSYLITRCIAPGYNPTMGVEFDPDCWLNRKEAGHEAYTEA